MTDAHADRRDARRAAARFGHTTTNPGLRITQRAIAARQQGARIMDIKCQEYSGPASGTGQRRTCVRKATRRYVVGSSVDVWVCTQHANAHYRDLIPVAYIGKGTK